MLLGTVAAAATKSPALSDQEPSRRGPAIVNLVDNSRPLLDEQQAAVGRCGRGQVLARETPAASEGHEVGHEHFVDDVNDAVISAHIGPCDGRTIDRNA